MTYQTPCQRSEAPDDWFLERDGRQHVDDAWVTDADRDEIREGLFNSDRITDIEAEVQRLLDQLEETRRKDAKTRRRHAIEACHNDCYLRLECLDIGLRPETLSHGVYGGYDAEQRREIVKVRDEKIAARQADE